MEITSHTYNPKAIMKQLFDSKGTPINLLQDSDIEYGSNSNGNYVKFPKRNGKGLLIQWGEIYQTNTDSIAVNLPLAFNNANYMVSVSQKWIEISTEYVIDTVTTSSFKVVYFKTNNNSLTGHTGSHSSIWSAIGFY